MDGGLLGLIGLALVDSTSVGTLVVPLVLLLRPRLRVGQFLVYLATIGGFYLLIGIAMLAGAQELGAVIGRAADSRVGLMIRLGIGVALFVLGVTMDPKKRRARREAAGDPRPPRWRRVLDSSSATPVLMLVALLAGVAELAMMLPYLAAIGILTTSGLGLGMRVGLLSGYVLVMLLPALVLLGVRLVLGSRVDDRLRRFGSWVARQAEDTLPWILAIVGLVLAGGAAPRLGLFG